MDIASRIGPAEADVILFSKGGRNFRLNRLMTGQEVPREFFYGFFDLESAGVQASMMSSAGRLPGAWGLLADILERGFAKLTALGVRPLSTRLSMRHFNGTKVLISYTDGFSLSLGLGLPRSERRPILIGGFHGLSDIEERVPFPLRGFARSIISRAMVRLDHAFFFGSADRDLAIQRYGVERDRSSVYAFGIDTDFWRPLPDQPEDDIVVAVGQDRNRDYDLLASAPGGHPIRIVTRQPIKVPPDARNVVTTAGDFFGADAMADEDLRQLYNRARAIVVPLKDVYQPSGYSVTLQAMSCGKPVILTKTRGLWAPDLFKHGENCLLVAPGDAFTLSEAIERIRSDAALRARVGRAARLTALDYFGLEKTGASTIALARLGLELHGKLDGVSDVLGGR